MLPPTVSMSSPKAIFPIVFILSVAALAPPVLGQAAVTQPLASAATNWDGITLDLVSVERKGSVLTVKWAVQNQSAAAVEIRFGLAHGTPQTYVVDEESGTKYYVLTDKEGKSLAAMHEYLGHDLYGVRETLAAGAIKRYWAKYPAPPPEVKTLTLFFDETEPFEEVPITEK